MGSLGSQDQSRARQKRREKFPDGRVEGERRFLHHAILRAERKSLLHPKHVVADRRVRHEDGLRSSRRTGGIDRVGHRRGMHRKAEVRVAFPVSFPGAPIDRQNAPDAGRQSPGETLLGQDHRGARLGEHESEPLPRIGGLKRQEGGPRLERTQDGDHHLGSTLHEDGHEDVGRGAETAQAPRQPVGTPVQLSIAEGPAVEGDADSVGRAPDLGLEELVDGVFAAAEGGARRERRRSGRRSLQTG